MVFPLSKTVPGPGKPSALYIYKQSVYKAPGAPGEGARPWVAWEGQKSVKKGEKSTLSIFSNRSKKCLGTLWGSLEDILSTFRPPIRHFTPRPGFPRFYPSPKRYLDRGSPVPSIYTSSLYARRRGRLGKARGGRGRDWRPRNR